VGNWFVLIYKDIFFSQDEKVEWLAGCETTNVTVDPVSFFPNKHEV
jgi:hypothetical protein